MTFPLPFKQSAAWTQQLKNCAAQALEFCPDFSRIAARHEAWWRGELSGPPLFLASAGTDPSVPGGRRLDLLTQPEAWMEARLAQLSQTCLVGDALPSIRVDYGPVCLGMLLGAPFEFSGDTTWTKSFIDQGWTNAPDWQIHGDNPWWQLLPRLLEINARTAQGRYLAMTPSLGGSSDVLLNMRGADNLCMDLADQPEKIQAAVDKIYSAWRIGFEKVWGAYLAQNAGVINWVGLWSEIPYHVLECDFNYMIGPQPFQQLFLPEIVCQAASVGRSMFHLDGPGAARHIDALLEADEISAVQYVTGAGNSALTRLAMLKKIQKVGKPLQVTVPAEEVIELSRQLDPAGLCLLVEHSLNAGDLQKLYEELCRLYPQA